MDHIYDVIILGAGPAGLSAGLYAGRSRLDTLIIEKGQAGGQIINTDEIENYPGQIVEGETGVSLVRRMYEQTEQFGAEHVRDTITDVELNGEIKVLTGEKDTYQAKNIIIATGAYARPIGCKGEQEYKGRGISYCATCDANFFTDLAGMQRWKKRCTLQNSPEKLRSFTEGTSCVRRSLFRKKHLPIRRLHSCGIR